MGFFKKEGKCGGMSQIVSSQQLVSSLAVGELSSVLATPGKVNIISKRWNYIFDATIRPILYGQLDICSSEHNYFVWLYALHIEL